MEIATEAEACSEIMETPSDSSTDVVIASTVMDEETAANAAKIDSGSAMESVVLDKWIALVWKWLADEWCRRLRGELSTYTYAHRGISLGASCLLDAQNDAQDVKSKHDGGNWRSWGGRWSWTTIEKRVMALVRRGGNV